MSSDVSEPNPASTPPPHAETEVPAAPATPAPTVPAARAATVVPTAWSDDQTRRTAQRRLRPTLVAAGLGLVALAAAVVVALLGILERPWGLWVLVALAGVAGGCLAGALAGWSIEAPMRRLLKRHPWEILAGHVGHGDQLWVVADQRRRAYDLDLGAKDDLGALGTSVQVRACGPVDEKVVDLGGRWRIAERVAVAAAPVVDEDDDDDDDWTPSDPLGERPDADGLYAG